MLRLFCVVLAVCPLGAAKVQGQTEVPSELAQAVQAGRDAAALSQLAALPGTQAEQPALRYLRGRLLERLRKPVQALAAFPDNADGLPARVADDMQRRRAELLLALGRHKQACPLFEARADERRSPQVLAALAECESAQGRPEAAATHLRAALAVRDVVRYRFALVEALTAAGQRRGAERELRALLVEHPSRTDRVLDALRALDASTHISSAERLARAERWRRARKPTQALAELDAGRPKGARQARAQWLHVRGMALFALRTRYEEAATVLARAARLRGETEQSDAFHAARALARADKDRLAVRALRRFARRYPRSRYTERALYLAAWLELRHDFRGGRRNMQRFADGKHGRRAPALQRRALFQLALEALSNGRHAAAKPLFERYAATDASAMVQARGLYWAGRAAAASGLLSEAHELYRRALSVEPLHYYALLSAARLREAGVDPGAPFGAATPPPGPAQAAAAWLPEDVRFYAALGLTGDARRALRAQEQQVRERAPAGGEVQALAAAYHQLGHFVRPRRLVVVERADLLRRPVAAASRWAWQAAYPRPYGEHLAPACRAHSVEPALAYAIMRKESGFDPDVVSYANALGLMQLLLKTAQELSPVTREQLLQPATNIELGVRYYGQLAQRFDGQAPLSIAAYNAGAHRVEPWLHGAPARDGRVALDLFVEHIPIDQTRNYVRRVITDWARYRYLEDPAGGWPLSPSLELRPVPPTRP